MPGFLDGVLVPWAASRVGKVEGDAFVPAHGPALIVPNHISYFDPIVLFAYLTRSRRRRAHFMAITKHWWFPGARVVARFTQTAFVNPKKPSTVLERMQTFLRRGDLCIVYPEGSRNPDPMLKQGKTGAARLALWEHIPVIPLGITGPGTRSIPKAWWNFLMDKKFNLHFGPPVHLDEFYGKEVTKELLIAATRKIMMAIAAVSGKSVST